MRSDQGRKPDDLSRLVSEYVDRLNTGERLDPAELLLRHPRLGEEILAQLEIFVAISSGSPDPDPLPLGTLGDFTLRRPIGHGGMGVVYEAHQNSMDRVVALKVLPPGVAADDRAFHRFMQEAKTAGRLNHHSVVSVYSTGVEEGTPWYSMEYVDGETLAQILARLRTDGPEAVTPFGRSSEQQFYLRLAEAFASVADGLHHAHSKGVVHRDIKPSNLILDRQDRLRILDFGLARIEGQDTLTASGDFVGTPLYMSPEQARRRRIPVDHRTDVYSLGATLYEAICGRPPFRGKDHADTLSQIVGRDPVDPRRANPHVPKDLETIVLKCLRKETDHRYGTAEALGQDLRRFVRGEVVEARAPTPAARLARRLRRHPARIAVAGLVALLAALAVVLLVAQQSEQRRRERAERARSDERYRDLVTRAIMESEEALTLTRTVLIPGAGFQAALVDSLDVSAEGLVPLELALARLDEAIRLQPGRLDAWLHRSRLHRALGDQEECSRSLELILTVDPDFAPAVYLRSELGGPEAARAPGAPEGATLEDGWSRIWIAAHDALADRRWAESAARFGELLEAIRRRGEPYIGARIELLLGRGRAHVGAARWLPAIEDFARAQALFPEALEPGRLLACTYHFMGEKDRADEILHELASSTASPERVSVRAAEFYVAVNEPTRATQWIGRLEEGATRYRLHAELAARQGHREEARRYCDRILSSRPDDVEALVIKGSSYIYDFMHGEADRGLRLLERALEIEPENVLALLATGWAVYRRADVPRALECFRKALDVLESAPGARRALTHELRARVLNGALWCQCRLGDLSAAQSTFDAAVAAHARLPHPWSALAELYRELERPADAARCDFEALERAPDSRSALEGTLLALERDDEEIGQPRWAVIASECRERMERGHDEPRILAVLALAGLRDASSTDVAAALTHAEAAVEGRRSPICLTILAEALWRSEKPARAVRLLEEAIQAPGAFERAHRLLERYRLAYLPSIASIRSGDWLMETVGQGGADSQGEAVVAARRRLLEAREPTDHHLLEFLESCLLVESTSADRVREGARRLRELRREAMLTDDERALCLRREVAGLLRIALAEEADRRVREELTSSSRSQRDLIDLWLQIQLVGLDRPPAHLLDDLPFTTSEGYGADVLWLLGRLADRDTIRIASGSSDEIVDHAGRVWSADRFSHGGIGIRNWTPKIVDTSDPELFRLVRSFGYGGREELRSGYRIPLPAGTYRIRIHTAETHLLAGPDRRGRRFDVRVEERTWLEGFDPLERGFATAIVEETEVEVADGRLEIDFVPRRLGLHVGAIEVVPLE